MDKSLYFDARRLRNDGEDASSSASRLPYTSSIAKFDDYLKYVSIDKQAHIDALSHRCSVLYASNIHLLRPKRGRLELMPQWSFLDIDPFSMALYTDKEYAEYELVVQTEATRRSKLKRKVIVIGKRRRAAGGSTGAGGSDSNKSPGVPTGHLKSTVVNDENSRWSHFNKVKRDVTMITTNASGEDRRDVSTGHGKWQAKENYGKGLFAGKGRRSEVTIFRGRTTVVSEERVSAPACHCGLFNRGCRLTPMIPEDCEESIGVEDSLSDRLKSNPEYLSLSAGTRRTAAKKLSVSAIDVDVRSTRISQYYLRQRKGTRTIAARRIQRLARSYMRKMRDHRSFLKSAILRREVCSRHVADVIIGAVFKKFDGVYETYRQNKERSYMQYEDQLMHSYEYYKLLQKALVHIEALQFGIKRMFGSMSPKLPRVAIDGRISAAWRPTYAFSCTSIRSQQLHLHPIRRVPASLLAHVTKHLPRTSQKEGMLADSDLCQFTNRFLRSIPYEKWRRRVAQAVFERRERRRLIAQQALEKLKARQNYKKDLLAQAEAISLANQNKANSAAKPPPGPPPRYVLVQAAEQLKLEQKQQLERDIQHTYVVEDREFSVQREYEQVHHPRRRYTLLDPVQLYSRLTRMRSRLVKSNKTKRRNSLPAQLSALYVDFQQPTPELRIAQISESLIMFEERLSALTSLCRDISNIRSGSNSINTSVNPTQSLNRCYNHMLKVMKCPVLNPRIPLEMHHALLDPNRRRTIAEPERLARQLSIMIDTREKFSEAIELSRRGLEINRRRRSFDVGEYRDSAQGIELILGITYVEQRVAATTSSLINDSENMKIRMVKAMMMEGDEMSLSSVRAASVVSTVTTEQDLQIRTLQQQMHQSSTAESSGTSQKKKSISSIAAVRGSPSKTTSTKVQAKMSLQVAGVGESFDAGTADNYESHRVDTAHFESTLIDEGDSVSQHVTVVDPQLYHTWQEHYDGEGRAYYYNACTGESLW